MFLVALLVGLCMPIKAEIKLQEPGDWLSIGGVTPDADGQTVYYLKNVGTGLMLSHGAEWGTAAAESQSAHPIIVESNGDGTYALGSLGGYLGSNMFMDRPKSESQWVLQPVADYPGQYYIQLGTGEDASLLSSIGNRMGKLITKTNEGKALQRWIFVDGNYMRNEIMPIVSENMPIDVSWAIRAGSFDKVGTWYPKVENGVPFTSEVFYSMMGDDLETNTDGSPIYHGYQAEYWTGLWGANRKYGAHCGNEGGWDDAAKNYNFCAIINKNNRDAASTLVSYKMTLPAGVYRLQYDAFYKFIETKIVQPQKRTRSNIFSSWKEWQNNGSETQAVSDKTMNITVEVSGNGLSTQTGTVPQNQSVIFDDGASAADEFRNAKNLAPGDEGYESRYGTFENNFTFRVNTRCEVTISIKKGATTSSKWDQEESVSSSTGKTTQTRNLVDYLYDYQLYLDNFCLYYSGVPSDAPEEVISPYDAKAAGNENLIKTMFWYYYPDEAWYSLRDLNRWLQNPSNKEIYDNWVAEHDYYFSEVPQPNRWGGYDESTLDELLITKDEYDVAKEAYETYTELSDAYDVEMQSRYESADKNMVFKNYLEANFGDYLNLLGDAGDAVFLEMMSEWLITESDGGVSVDKNKVTSRVKYYDAIELMEEAFLQAKIADMKAGVLEGGNDYTGLIANPSFEIGYVTGRGSTIGWELEQTTSWDVLVASRTTNFGSFVTEGMHENNLFNIYPHGARIKQTIAMPKDNGKTVNFPNGTYLLSALVTSDPGATIYLTAKPNNAAIVNRGLNTLGAGVFDDYGMRVDLKNAQDLTIGVVGGKEDDWSYIAEGGKWYKCDHFRFEFLPDGVLTLNQEADRITNIDDSFHGMKVERSKMSTTNWSTFVVPFSMAVPSTWQVMRIKGAQARPVVDENGDSWDDLNLQFEAETETIEAGVPYLVRLNTADNNDGVISTPVSVNEPNVAVNTRYFENPVIKLSGDNHEYTVEFIGTYNKINVPNSLDAEGNETGTNYYFLSQNKFFRSTGYKNVMKGFRGYFKVSQTLKEGGDANANGLRSLAMTRTEADIECVADNEEVTVVGIYNVNGVKLDSMQPGINILRMSNGNTKKIMIK